MADVIENNLQATIFELKNEAKNVAKEIASANFDRDKAVQEKQEAIKELSNIRNECEITSKIEVDLQKKIDTNRVVFHDESISFKEKKEQERNQFKKEEKEYLKELNRLNISILEAKDEEEKYVDKLFLMKQKIESQNELFEKILTLENDISGLEKKRDALKIENQSLIDHAELEIEILQGKIEEIKKQIIQLNLEAEYARIAKQRIDDEAVHKSHDLKIYYSRVKHVWDEVFPGRNMPII